MSDPSGFLTNPPTTVVKIQNTARDDMNGQLGIAVAYQQDRSRYLIHNVVTQQTIALKPENLIKASMVETAKGQFLQLKHDPKMQQKIREFHAKAKKTLHPIKPEYAAVGLLLLWIGLTYFVGFTKTVMVTSILLLLGIIVAPDIMEGASIKTMLTNIPRRSRESIEQTVPALRGRLSNRMAAGIVLIMVLMAGKAVFTPKATAPRPANTNTMNAVPTTSPPHHASIQAVKEEYYKLGFEDATNGLDFGTSLATETTTPRGLSSQNDEFPLEFDDGMDYAAVPPEQSRGFGFSSIMSVFYIGRTAYELGKDPVAGGFSPQRMVANAKTLESWKMAMLAFSLYNLVRSLM